MLLKQIDYTRIHKFMIEVQRVTVAVDHGEKFKSIR